MSLRFSPSFSSSFEWQLDHISSPHSSPYHSYTPVYKMSPLRVLYNRRELSRDSAPFLSSSSDHSLCSLPLFIPFPIQKWTGSARRSPTPSGSKTKKYEIPLSLYLIALSQLQNIGFTDDNVEYWCILRLIDPSFRWFVNSSLSWSEPSSLS